MTKRKLNEFWTVTKTLAERLGVPRTTILYAVRRGDIPSQTLGSGETVVREQDVLDWMATGQETGKPRTWELL